MRESPRNSIVLIQQANEATADELALSEKLGIPLMDKSFTAPDYDFALRYLTEGLCLSGLRKDNRGSLIVDFNDAKLRRRSQEPLWSQNLGKAIGLHKQRELSVLDATSGFAKDAFLLAMAGCEVTALERSPLVYALVQNGIHRAYSSVGELPAALQRLSYWQMDFLEFKTNSAEYDVVYLDPMFPDDNRSAKSRKSMHYLQVLLETPSDEELLLQHALAIAGNRVVVKRGRRSPIAGKRQPDLQLKGKSSRFDVYFTNAGSA